MLTKTIILSGPLNHWRMQLLRKGFASDMLVKVTQTIGESGASLTIVCCNEDAFEFIKRRIATICFSNQIGSDDEDEAHQEPDLTYKVL